MLQAKCFIILSFLITEAEITLLENTGSVIRFIINLLSNSLTSEKGLARGFSTSEILLALNNLALHDKNKLKIVEYGGLAQIAIALKLQQQTNNKSAIQTLAAELTWKLSFMEENRENIKTEKGLIEAITLLKSSAHGKLKTACSGALWETFEGIFEEADDSSDEQQQTTHLKKVPHVMISYQWDVQPRIIQLKQKLQNAGYNVWMDIDQMEGDLLGAMASAVENAVVMIACISQKYKDSTSCRTEATYAYKQNKPILPLIVQHNYTADGWLGAFIGTLKYYPLYKDSMVATEFQNIKSEIGERGKVNSPCKDVCGVCTTDSSTIQLHSTHNGPAGPSDVSKWTSKHVTDWLKRNKMPEICNSMKNVNGKILIQMYKMSNKAPDFFYSRLERDFKMNNLMQILKFSNLMDDLFE
ncbi:uncharacterized protein [Antedon mediterranea]|uniref:uncharacterized protein n=1 Tax=Antedon mediterranea TaxID=105859 RepID=UPI003AF7ECD9